MISLSFDHLMSMILSKFHSFQPVFTTAAPVVEDVMPEKEASLERAYELPREDEPEQLPPQGIL